MGGGDETTTADGGPTDMCTGTSTEEEENFSIGLGWRKVTDLVGRVSAAFGFSAERWLLARTACVASRAVRRALFGAGCAGSGRGWTAVARRIRRRKYAKKNTLRRRAVRIIVSTTAWVALALFACNDWRAVAAADGPDGHQPHYGAAAEKVLNIGNCTHQHARAYLAAAVFARAREFPPPPPPPPGCLRPSFPSSCTSHAATAAHKDRLTLLILLLYYYRY